jgi:predicted metal-binding protein
MTYEKLAAMAEEAGFTAWAKLDPNTIELKSEVRDMCAANSCGMYGKRWSCPPGCGTLEECAEKLKGYTGGILVQTVGDIEDGFDFEAMMEIEAEHRQNFRQMQEALLDAGITALPIGAGCCTVCPQCTYPDAPCRFPEKMNASMEAYGMLVLQICKDNGLTYYYGADKMAYTSCFLTGNTR